MHTLETQTLFSLGRDGAACLGAVAMGVPALRVRLLGGFDLRLGEAALPSLESARAEELLAYLLLHREAPQARQGLAFLLWPDSTESQARTNLRHVLHNLRRALPDLDRFLSATPRALQWRADASLWLDVDAFERAISRAEQADDPESSLAALREAVDLYTGDLLEGSFDEWLLAERDRLLQRFLGVLQRLATRLEARGDYAEAIGVAERLLRHDPLREESFRLLMRLHGGRGDPARALRVYHACATTLERELGVEPSAETRRAYEALLPAEPDAPASDQADVRSGRPSLVGRAAERARLAALWRATEQGQAQFVLVSGEPGIGKTRLIEEFRSWCAHRGAVTAVARAYAAEGGLAYAPVVEWLRSDGLRVRPERLDRAYLSELARLLPELPELVPGLPRPDPLTEGEQRLRLFDAVSRAIRAAGAPVLLVADDLHWYDRETLQFLHYLLRVEPSARLLVAAAARREELDREHPLNDLLSGLQVLERCTEIEVGRLSRGETAALAERVIGRELAEPEAGDLHGATEGNPLFIVEALRAGWHGRPSEREWPNPKVQAVIESRLARLSAPAREVVGVAATIGREFTAEVLAHASGADENVLVGSLDELWRRRIVREQGADAYDFSHDTIREVAYLGLSPARRRHLHLRVARAVELLHAREPDAVSGQLAIHYDRGGAPDQAVVWYRRAAEAAQQLHANAEAIRLLDRALELLHALPETPERHALEVAILSALPAPLVAVAGYQSHRVAAMQRRALELTQALGIEPDPALLRSLAVASLSRDDFAGARGIAEQLRTRGERDADDVLLVEAGYTLGVAAFWQGEFGAARGHFQFAVAHYRPEQRRIHLLRYGQDPKVVCLNRLAYTLWFLGQPEAAMRERDAAVALADEIGHPYTRRVALSFGALLSLEIREHDRLRALVTALAALGGDDAMHTRSLLDVLGGYVDVLDGREAAGIARIQRAIDGAAEATAPGMHAAFLRVFMEACATAGAAPLGLAAAGRILGVGAGARLWEAEARRRRAEFLTALGAPDREVEEEFDRGLQVARHQGARSLELRAAMSLLRYRQEHGDRAAALEARDLLLPILDGFPEGQDTPDLRDAAVLLALH